MLGTVLKAENTVETRHSLMGTRDILDRFEYYVSIHIRHVGATILLMR